MVPVEGDCGHSRERPESHRAPKARLAPLIDEAEEVETVAELPRSSLPAAPTGDLTAGVRVSKRLDPRSESVMGMLQGDQLDGSNQKERPARLTRADSRGTLPTSPNAEVPTAAVEQPTAAVPGASRLAASSKASKLCGVGRTPQSAAAA